MYASLTVEAAGALQLFEFTMVSIGGRVSSFSQNVYSENPLHLGSLIIATPHVRSPYPTLNIFGAKKRA